MTSTTTTTSTPPTDAPVAASQTAALARGLALSALGSAAFGAAVAAGHGARAMLQGAWLAPALFLGGAALAVPPLYMATALSGGETSPADVVRVTARALFAVALALLGLVAPAAYFSVTLGGAVAFALLLAVVALVGGAGVVAVAGDTFARENNPRARLAAMLWCGFALALGARLIAALGHAAGLFGHG